MKIKLCEKKACTGCSACMNICPKMAIQMKPDEYGFLYPDINEEQCVHCGACEHVCPENNPIKMFEPRNAYATFSTDDSIHTNSTSGGLAQALSLYILSEGGIVYGHGFDENFKLCCFRIDDRDGLKRARGTKYVQSFMGNMIREMKCDMTSGRKVLFIGTPCQVAGVISMLKPDLSNFISVNFVCGGTPSPQFFDDYLEYHKLKDDNTEIYFRNNNEYGFYLFKDGYSVGHIDRWKSTYFIGFDEHVIQRESCYHCRYANPSRCGDITIGDYWGLQYTSISKADIEKGVSLAIPTSEKGQKILFDCVASHKIILEEHEFIETTKENPRLIFPIERTGLVDRFRKMYLVKGYVKAINSIFYSKYAMLRIKRQLKKIKLFDKIYHIGRS